MFIMVEDYYLAELKPELALMLACIVDLSTNPGLIHKGDAFKCNIKPILTQRFPRTHSDTIYAWVNKLAALGYITREGENESWITVNKQKLQSVKDKFEIGKIPNSTDVQIGKIPNSDRKNSDLEIGKIPNNPYYNKPDYKHQTNKRNNIKKGASEHRNWGIHYDVDGTQTGVRASE